MSKFITAVSMACTQEQYERDLRQPLLDMGYKERDISKWDKLPVLVNNFSNEIGVLNNVEIACKGSYKRYFIDHYNPELYLALAAMTNKLVGIAGEWWVYIGRNGGSFTREALYKGLSPINLPEAFLDDRNLTNGHSHNPLKFFRKATKEEIINHLTKNKMEKKDLRELLQSGRIVELRNGDIGIIIQTHKGLLIQYRDVWDDVNKYDADLESTTNHGCGIMRIREIILEYQIIREDFKDASIVWERKEIREYTLDEVLKMAGLDKAEVKVKVTE